MDLFVYGTLRRGYSAHNRLMREAAFIGPAVAQGRRLGTSHFAPSDTWSLDGELYSLPFSSMQALDEYEGHPNLWIRREVSVRRIENGEPLTASQPAWLYFPPSFAQ